MIGALRQTLTETAKIEAVAETLASILTSYAFTMVGFFVAAVSFLLSLGDSIAFRNFADRGRVRGFVYGCLITVGAHFVTFITGMLIVVDLRFLDWSLAFALVNMLQVMKTVGRVWRLAAVAAEERATRAATEQVGKPASGLGH